MPTESPLIALFWFSVYKVLAPVRWSVTSAIEAASPVPIEEGGGSRLGVLWNRISTGVSNYISPPRTDAGGSTPPPTPQLETWSEAAIALVYLKSPEARDRRSSSGLIDSLRDRLGSSPEKVPNSKKKRGNGGVSMSL